MTVLAVSLGGLLILLLVVLVVLAIASIAFRRF